MKRDVAALESRTFDLLVVGGGIAGAAAAWDAAQRGLSVALVEARDFGSATSWNSLKTIHGGLRHLQRLDIGGLRESVRERRALLRIAPALVRPLSFVVPARGLGARSRAGYAAAAFLYGLLSRDRNDGVPPERHLAPARVLDAAELAAGVPGFVGSGGLLWQDAQVAAPEALVLAMVRAACADGAVAANYAPAERLVRDGGRVTGAHVQDAVARRPIVVKARVVLGALGAGLDDWLARSGVPATRLPWLAALNLVVHRPPPTTMAVGGEAGGRTLFLVPWRGRTMIGTDYARRDAAAGRAAVLRDDARRAFPFFTFGDDDVRLVHCGFALGEAATSLRTRDVFLDHEADGAPGLLTATAAKFTTARALAERAVDAVFRRLGRPLLASRTSATPLPVEDDAGLAIEERTRRAMRDGMALHLADVVLRRTDLGTAGPPAPEDVERVVRVMAAERGWDADHVGLERADLAGAYEGRMCQPISG